MRVCAHTGAVFLLQKCSKSGVAGASALNISVSTEALDFFLVQFMLPGQKRVTA